MVDLNQWLHYCRLQVQTQSLSLSATHDAMECCRVFLPTNPLNPFRKTFLRPHQAQDVSGF